MKAVPRILALAASAALPALLAAPSFAQQVTPAMYERIMKSESQAIKAYRGAATNKAFAACIDWSKTTGGNAAVPAGGYGFGQRSTISAKQNAMSNCARIKQERNAQSCACQVIDVNGLQSN